MSEVPDASRRPIFGFRFSQLTQAEIVEETMRPLEPGAGGQLIVTANLHHIIQLREHADLRAAYAHARIRTIDGAPVMLYAMLRGANVPQRVTGADLVPPLLARLRPDQHRLFFVAATDTIVGGLRRWAQNAGFSDDQVGYVVPPYGFDHDADYSKWLADSIRANRTTHLFMGVGCPKSEVWTDRHRRELGDCFVFAIGAALAFFVGEQRRAPLLMRKTGFEWLWRVAQEPRRLGKRYFVESWRFLNAVIADMRGGGAGT